MVESKNDSQALFHLAMGNTRYALELAASPQVRGQVLLAQGLFQEAIDAVKSD
jgi:hypothetical protein